MEQPKQHTPEEVVKEGQKQLMETLDKILSGELLFSSYKGDTLKREEFEMSKFEGNPRDSSYVDMINGFLEKNNLPREVLSKDVIKKAVISLMESSLQGDSIIDQMDRLYSLSVISEDELVDDPEVAEALKERLIQNLSTQGGWLGEAELIINDFPSLIEKVKSEPIIQESVKRGYLIAIARNWENSYEKIKDKFSISGTPQEIAKEIIELNVERREERIRKIKAGEI